MVPPAVLLLNILHVCVFSLYVWLWLPLFFFCLENQVAGGEFFHPLKKQLQDEIEYSSKSHAKQGWKLKGAFIFLPLIYIAIVIFPGFPYLCDFVLVVHKST